MPRADLVQGEFGVGMRSGRGEWLGLAADLLLPVECCAGGRGRPPGHAGDPFDLPRCGRDHWWWQWLEQAGVATDGLPQASTVALSVAQFEVPAAVASGGLAAARSCSSVPSCQRPPGAALRASRARWRGLLAGLPAGAQPPKVRAFRLLEQAPQTRAGTA